MKVKRNHILAFLLIMFTVWCFSSIQVQAQDASKETELLIEYANVHHSLTEEPSIDGVETIEKIAPNVELWSIAEDVDIQEITKQLQNEPGVLTVEPNYERYLHVSTNDPWLTTQWWIQTLRPESIWTRVNQQKKSIVVAVIDSGIATKHEDLQGRIQPGGYNFHGDNTNVEDVNGHGTSVAGVLAATYSNNKGITGIAGPYNVKILPLKVSHITGTSYVSDTIRAIDYAIENKADVINLSLGSDESSTAENAAIQRAIQAGISVVASAGNEAEEGNPISYPASYENVISVGATDSQNRRSTFSNYNSYVSLVAPGTGIYTTGLSNSYKSMNGTSFSSPIVAGAAGLIKSIQPDYTPKQIKQLLENTAIDLGVPGRDSHFGAGLLNLERLNNALAASVVRVQRVELDRQKLTLDLDHKRNQSATNEEPTPNFAFDNAFMIVGETSLFLPRVESGAKLTSSNPQVATVDANGTVRAIAKGTATIRYASNTTTKEARIKVATKTNHPKSALFEKVLPVDAADQSVTWTSSNPAVAEVDEDGIITGKQAGYTVITVRTRDGGLTASTAVNVIGGQAPIEFVGDFPAMSVEQDKVFTINFNQELQAGKDYSQDIQVSRKPDGTDRVTSFTAKVDPTSLKKLRITPIGKWDEGTHYLTIKKGLQNAHFVSLKNDVRMKFDVIKTNEPPLNMTYTFESNYDFDWKYTKGDYSQFRLDGMKDGNIVAGYTTTANNGYEFPGNIGNTRNQIIQKHGEPLTFIMKDRTKYIISEQELKLTYLIDGKYVTFLIDQHDQHKVRSIFWVNREVEERAKYWYKTPSERYRQDSEKLMYELVNQARFAAGLPVLTENDSLATAARRHSQDMALNNYFSHTNLRGENPSKRVENIGLRPNATGENISQGYLNTILAHEGLMNSIGHRNNILSPKYYQLGIGVAFNNENKPYVTQNFYIYPE
ncbi:S8 family serine peptidase [Sporosarcina sp. GW1-11]|uniref:S8 family serine peptidase n=1 Tax=Sporosarcina sp. GW1-11 TaxID=2899126 RepID=UPI00294EBC36|nr:S8 family serine peptidase [Sporosarcina sp. GW1-11]MDV6378774.1 S8 family serine peptidase [Sporosarcina sp. GW1-11]